MQTSLYRLASFLERNHRNILIAVLLFILLFGVIYSFALGDRLRYLPDEQEYLSLTSNMLSDRGYSLDGISPTAYRPPGYPLFMAMLGVFSLNIIYFRVFNFLLLFLSAFLVYKILIRQSSALAASVGTLFLLGYPVLFYTAGTLYPQSLATFLLVLALFFLAKDTAQDWEYLVSGLLIGFLVLTVPTFVFLLIILLGWIGFQHIQNHWKGILITTTGAILVIGLWTARNLSVFDKLVLISTNSGENLLLGNSEYTTPNAGTNTDISRYVAQASDLDEVEKDRFYLMKAIDNIWNQKERFIRLYFLKFLNYFNFRNELVTRSESSFSKDLVMLFTFGPLLMLFVLRLLLLKFFSPSPFEILLIVVYLSSALITAVFFPRIRFRVPFDILLIMTVAVFLDMLIRKWGYKANEHKMQIEATL